MTPTPTSKASLASAALGCAQLDKMVRDLTDEQIDDIVGYSEARRLDETVWNLLDYAQRRIKEQPTSAAGIMAKAGVPNMLKGRQLNLSGTENE